MPVPIYEVETVCDNCGCILSRREVSARTFDLLAQEDNLPLPEVDPVTGEMLGDEDLLQEDGDRPVEALVQHIGCCPRCGQ